MVRWLQGVVHLCVIVQLILNSSERGLCLSVGGARRRNGDRADGRSKLVIDPMRELAQQKSLGRRSLAPDWVSEYEGRSWHTSLDA